MDLGTAQQILVIVLASMLALFLILSIVIAILVIKVLKVVRRITEKAELIADKAEHVADFFQKSAGPTSLIKLISNLVHTVQGKDKK